MRTLAATATVLLLLVGGCQSKDNADTTVDNPTSAATSGTPTPTSRITETPVAETPSSASGDTSGVADPCDLLTADIAREALGVAVKPPTTTPGKGNVTCSYAPADGRPNVFVLLTTYEASGEAALRDATKAFPDAQPVPDLGDAAYVSPRGHAIGVSAGDLLFGVSLLTPQGLEQSAATTVHELTAVAQAVLEAQ
ncbi:DUF3558 family protein [Nocardioides sp.]|jgi:hypothetical protein|uniref:DUF3558 family protein n=1 Tax=Nocardioides sp. TaxID=35761 RepID=UPI0031FEA2D1|nr:hypothetical protein [Nocardioides sp.]